MRLESYRLDDRLEPDLGLTQDGLRRDLRQLSMVRYLVKHRDRLV